MLRTSRFGFWVYVWCIMYITLQSFEHCDMLQHVLAPLLLQHRHTTGSCYVVSTLQSDPCSPNCPVTRFTASWTF